MNLSTLSRIFRSRGWNALPLFAPGLALANPAGGVVVGGDVGFVTPDANTLIINQSSHNAAINWQSFSIQSSEYVIFNQPSASAVVLNRVVGGNPSEILGNLQANGRVFLINPMGVLFGEGAQIDVGGIVASTLDLSPDDFMAGRYVLRGDSQAGVVNTGNISASDGGFVVLLGDHVTNTGAIHANLGSVVLASGSQVTLDFTGDGLIQHSVDTAAISDRAGVEHLGSIVADGGHVVMDANVTRDLKASVINTQGLVQARRIVKDGRGGIYLAGRGGDIALGGTLDASGVADDAQGGRVIVTTDGDITMPSGSTIRAQGGSAARGGEVRVVAKGEFEFANGALIDASGGTSGGFVELSGHEHLTIRGDVNLGRGGTLLIDPRDVTISDAGANGAVGQDVTLSEEFIEQQLYTGTDVIIVADRSIYLQTLSDGVLDGIYNPGTMAYTGTGGLTLGIGTVEMSAVSLDGNGAAYDDAIYNFSRGAGYDGYGILFQNPANTIRTYGDINIISGHDYGYVNVGLLTATGGGTAGDIYIASIGEVDTGALSANQNISISGTDVLISGNAIATNGSVVVNASAGAFDIIGNLAGRDGVSVNSRDLLQIGGNVLADDGSIVLNAGKTYAGSVVADSRIRVTGSVRAMGNDGTEGGVSLNAYGQIKIDGDVISAYASNGPEVFLKSDFADIDIESGTNVAVGEYNGIFSFGEVEISGYAGVDIYGAYSGLGAVVIGATGGVGGIYVGAGGIEAYTNFGETGAAVILNARHATTPGDITVDGDITAHNFGVRINYGGGGTDLYGDVAINGNVFASAAVLGGIDIRAEDLVFYVDSGNLNFSSNRSSSIVATYSASFYATNTGGEQGSINISNTTMAAQDFVFDAVDFVSLNLGLNNLTGRNLSISATTINNDSINDQLALSFTDSITLRGTGEIILGNDRSVNFTAGNDLTLESSGHVTIGGAGNNIVLEAGNGAGDTLSITGVLVSLTGDFGVLDTAGAQNHLYGEEISIAAVNALTINGLKVGETTTASTTLSGIAGVALGAYAHVYGETIAVHATGNAADLEIYGKIVGSSSVTLGANFGDADLIVYGATISATGSTLTIGAASDISITNSSLSGGVDLTANASTGSIVIDGATLYGEAQVALHAVGDGGDVNILTGSNISGGQLIVAAYSDVFIAGIQDFDFSDPSTITAQYGDVTGSSLSTLTLGTTDISAEYGFINLPVSSVLQTGYLDAGSFVTASGGPVTISGAEAGRYVSLTSSGTNNALTVGDVSGYGFVNLLSNAGSVTTGQIVLGSGSNIADGEYGATVSAFNSATVGGATVGSSATRYQHDSGYDDLAITAFNGNVTFGSAGLRVYDYSEGGHTAALYLTAKGDIKNSSNAAAGAIEVSYGSGAATQYGNVIFTAGNGSDSAQSVYAGDVTGQQVTFALNTLGGDVRLYGSDGGDINAYSLALNNLDNFSADDVTVRNETFPVTSFITVDSGFTVTGTLTSNHGLDITTTDGDISIGAISTPDKAVRLEAQDASNSGADITVGATSVGNAVVYFYAADNITLNGDIVTTGTRNVFVTADYEAGDETGDALGSINTTSSDYAITATNVVLRAAQGINAYASASTHVDFINSAAGNVTLGLSNVTNVYGTDSGAGNISIAATNGNLNVGSAGISGGAGTISITTNDGNLTTLGAVTSTNGAITLDANDGESGTKVLTVGSGGISAGTAALTLRSDDDIVINGNVAGGSILIAADDDDADGTADLLGSITGTGYLNSADVDLFAASGIATKISAGSLDVAFTNKNTGAVDITQYGSGMAISYGNNMASGGSININSSPTGGSGSLSVNGSLTSNNGAITITVGGNDTSFTNNLSIGTGSINAGSGNVTLRSIDSVEINGTGVTTTGNVTIEANHAGTESTGQINGSLNGRVTGNHISLTAAGGIGVSGAILRTDAETLSFSTTTGSVDISELDGFTVYGSDGTGAVSISSDTGNLVVGGTGINGGSGDLTLTAFNGDLIVNAAIAATGANTINLTAKDTDAVGVSNATLTVNQSVSNGTGLIDLNSADDIVINAAVMTVGNLTIDAEAGGTETANDDLGSISGLGLISGNDISIGAATGVSISTSVNSLSIQNTTSGLVSVVEANGLEIDSPGVLNAAGSGVSIRLLSGDLAQNAGISAGGSNVTLNAESGNIAGSTFTITGGLIDLYAGAASGYIGTSTTAIKTSGSTISFTAHGAGDVFITEGNAGTFYGSTGSGAIDLRTTTGSLLVGNPASAGISTTGAVILTAGGTGSILDGDTADLDITAGAVSLYAGTAIGGGISDPLEIATSQLYASAGTGAIDLANVPTAAVTINGFSNSGAGAIRYSQNGQALNINGAITSGSGGVVIDPPSSITINAAINAGGGAFEAYANDGITFADGGYVFNASTAYLDADANNNNLGAIVDTQTADITDITALGLVTLEAATGIGSNSNRIEIDAANLAATNSSSGDVFLSLQRVAGTTINSINAVAGTIDISSPYALTANTLTSTGSAVHVTGASVSLTGAVYGSTGINVTSTDGNITTGSGLISSTNSAINFTAIDAAGGAFVANIIIDNTGTTTGDINAGSGVINIRAADDIALGADVTSTGTVTIAADYESGDITPDNVGMLGYGLGARINGNVVSLSAYDSITALTNAGSLSFANKTGNITLSELNVVTVTYGDAENGSIFLTSSTGQMTLEGNIYASSVAEFNAAGSSGIRQSGVGRVQATTVRLLTGSGGIGQSSNRILTTADNLYVDATGSGAYVSEANGVNFSGQVLGGGDIDVMLQAAGNLTTNGDVYGTGNVTLRATDGDIVYGSGLVSGNLVTLTAGGTNGDIGTSTNLVRTNANTVNFTGTTTGQVHIRESDSVTFYGSTGSGLISLTSTTGDLIVGGTIVTSGTAMLDAEAGSALHYGGTGRVQANLLQIFTGGNNRNIGTSTNRMLTSATTLHVDTDAFGYGDIYITEADAVTVSVAATGAGIFDLSIAGAGDVLWGSGGFTSGGAFVTTADGSILRSGGGIFTANQLVLTANGTNRSIGASGNAIETRTTTGYFQASGTGSVYITERADGGAATFYGSTGSGAINLATLGGNLTVGGDITTSGTIQLNAAGGGLRRTSGTVSASSAQLLSASGGVGTSVAPILTDIASLSAAATGAGGIFIAEANAVTLTGFNLVNGDVSLVTETGNLTLGGDITTTGNTTLMATAGDILRTAGTVYGSTVALATGAGAGNNIGAFGAEILTRATTLSLNTNSTSSSAYVSEFDGVDLAASSIGDDLYLTAGGHITDSGSLAVTDDAQFSVGGNDITLNAANNFASEVRIVSANNVTLNDTNALLLGTSTISGNLTVTTVGSIQDSGSLEVSGATSLSAGTSNSISLNNSGNNLSTVSVSSASSVTLVDSNALTIGSIANNGAVNITANTGNLTFGNISSTGNAITLNAVAGNLIRSGGTVSANNVVTLIAGGPSGAIGSSGTGAIQTHATVVNFTGQGTGGVYIDETSAGGGNVVFYGSTGSGVIELGTTSRTIIAGASGGSGISTTGSAILAAGGSIFDGTSAGGIDITASSISLYAGGAIGGSFDALDVSTSALYGSAGVDRDINLSGGSLSGPVSITGLSTSGIGGIRYSQNGQALSIDGAITSGTGGISIDPPNSITINAALNAGGGAFEAYADNGITFEENGYVFNATTAFFSADYNADDTGAIVDAQTTDITDITASGLVTLNAATGVGSNSSRLDVAAANLVAANSTNSGVFLSLKRALGATINSISSALGQINVSSEYGFTANNLSATGGVSVADITLANAGGNITLGGAITTTGHLSADSEAGSLTDSNGAMISAATFDFDATSITLADYGTDALVTGGNVDLYAGTGAISVGLLGSANLGTTTFHGGTVSIREDASAILLGGTNTATTLTLNSGDDINDVDGTSLTVSGLADLTALRITLGNYGTDVTNFGLLALDTTYHATISEDSSTAFTNVNTGTTLNVTSAGSITDSIIGPLNVAGVATFTAGAGYDIVLDKSDNDFAEVAVVGARNVTLVDKNAITLGSITSTGALTVTAVGAITDSGDLSVTNNAYFSGASVLLGGLTETTNFGTLTFNSTGAVNITEDSTMVVTGVNAAGNLSLATSIGGIDTSATALVASGFVALVATSGDINTQNITAGGYVDLDANAGNITTGNLSGYDRVFTEASGNVVLGAIQVYAPVTATFETLGAEITADGNVTVGAITVGTDGEKFTSNDDTSIAVQAQTGYVVLNGDVRLHGGVSGGVNPDIAVMAYGDISGGNNVQAFYGTTYGDLLIQAGPSSIGGNVVLGDLAGYDVTVSAEFGAMSDGDITLGAVYAANSLSLNADGTLSTGAQSSGDDIVITAETLSFAGDVSARLIDLTITGDNSNFIFTNLTGTSSVTVDTVDGYISGNNISGSSIGLTAGDNDADGLGYIGVGALTSTTTLDLVAYGSITATGAVVVTGDTTLEAGEAGAAYSVQINNTGNDFNGTVSVAAARDVVLTDVDDLSVGAINASGDIRLTSAAGIELGGAIQAGGYVDVLTANGNIDGFTTLYQNITAGFNPGVDGLGYIKLDAEAGQVFVGDLSGVGEIFVSSGADDSEVGSITLQASSVATNNFGVTVQTLMPGGFTSNLDVIGDITVGTATAQFNAVDGYAVSLLAHYGDVRQDGDVGIRVYGDEAVLIQAYGHVARGDINVSYGSSRGDIQIDAGFFDGRVNSAGGTISVLNSTGRGIKLTAYGDINADDLNATSGNVNLIAYTGEIDVEGGITNSGSVLLSGYEGVRLDGYVNAVTALTITSDYGAVTNNGALTASNGLLSISAYGVNINASLVGQSVDIDALGISDVNVHGDVVAIGGTVDINTVDGHIQDFTGYTIFGTNSVTLNAGGADGFVQVGYVESSAGNISLFANGVSEFDDSVDVLSARAAGYIDIHGNLGEVTVREYGLEAGTRITINSRSTQIFGDVSAADIEIYAAITGVGDITFSGADISATDTAYLGTDDGSIVHYGTNTVAGANGVTLFARSSMSGDTYGAITAGYVISSTGDVYIDALGDVLARRVTAGDTVTINSFGYDVSISDSGNGYINAPNFVLGEYVNTFFADALLGLTSLTLNTVADLTVSSITAAGLISLTSTGGGVTTDDLISTGDEVIVSAYSGVIFNGDIRGAYGITVTSQSGEINAGILTSVYGDVDLDAATLRLDGDVTGVNVYADSAGFISIGGDITATAGVISFATVDGAISAFEQNLSGRDGVSLVTGAGEYGDITISSGSITSTAGGVTLNAGIVTGAGNSFDGAFAETITAYGDIVLRADNGTADFGDFLDSETGDVSLLGQYVAVGNITAHDSVLISAAGTNSGVGFSDSNVTAATGTLTVTTVNGDIVGFSDGYLISGYAGVVFDANGVDSDVVFSTTLTSAYGSISLSAADEIDVADLNAAGGASLDAEGGRARANVIGDVSFSQITAYTDVLLTATGSIGLNDTMAGGLISLDAETGDLTFTNGGTVQANLLTADAVNIFGYGFDVAMVTDFYLTATGGDIALADGDIVAGGVADLFAYDSLSLINTDVTAYGLALNAGGDVYLDPLVLRSDSDITINAGGSVTGDQADLYAGTTLEIDAGSDVQFVASSLNSYGLSVDAGVMIDLAGAYVSVFGYGSVDDDFGVSESALADPDLPFVPVSANPNARFRAASVSLGELTMTGDYLFIAAGSLSLTPAGLLSVPTDILVQLTTFDTNASIHVVGANFAGVQIPGHLYLSAANHFARFPGTTYTLGGDDFAGNVLVGEGGGGVAGGAADFFFFTQGGTVSGLNAISTSGSVAILDLIATPPPVTDGGASEILNEINNDIVDDTGNLAAGNESADDSAPTDDTAVLEEEEEEDDDEKETADAEGEASAEEETFDGQTESETNDAVKKECT